MVFFEADDGFLTFGDLTVNEWGEEIVGFEVRFRGVGFISGMVFGAGLMDCQKGF